MKQYDSTDPNKYLHKDRFISAEMLRYLNSAIDSEGDEGMIVVSSFAFVELLNKFDNIFQDRSVSLKKLASFIEKPPKWFIIDELNMEVARHFHEVPIKDTHNNSISGDDAIHLATALTRRGDKLFFMTSDFRIKNLEIEGITFI